MRIKAPLRDLSSQERASVIRERTPLNPGRCKGCGRRVQYRNRMDLAAVAGRTDRICRLHLCRTCQIDVWDAWEMQ